MPLDAKNLVKFSMIKFWLNFTRGMENPGVRLDATLQALVHRLGALTASRPRIRLAQPRLSCPWCATRTILLRAFARVRVLPCVRERACARLGGGLFTCLLLQLSAGALYI